MNKKVDYLHEVKSKLELLSSKILEQVNSLSGVTDSPLLVVDHNRATTSLAVVKKNSSKDIDIIYFDETPSSIPLNDINILVDKMLSTGIKAPKDALLITCELIPALLDLSIDSVNQMSESQLEEMIAWEMEMMVHEQSTIPSISELLIQQGFLSYIDFKQALVANENSEVDTVHTHLLSVGQITHEDISACENIRTQLMTSSQEICIGWDQNKNKVEESDSSTLCAGMLASHHAKWLEIFKQHNIRLIGIYPALITGALSLSVTKQSAMSKSILLVNIDFDSANLISVSPEHIEKIETISLQNKIISIHDVCQQIQNFNAPSDIHVVGTHPDISSFVECIDKVDHSETDCAEQMTLLKNTSVCEDVPIDLLARYLGVTKAFFSPNISGFNLFVKGEPPPPPLHKRPKNQIIFAIFIALLMLLGIEMTFYHQAQSMSAELTEINIKTQSRLDANQKIITINDEVTALKEQLSQFELEHKDLSLRNTLIMSVMIERQEFVQTFLPMITRTIPKNVVLSGIAENDWYEFNVLGWAINQSEVDNFNTALSQELADWGLHINESPSQVNETNGRYEFIFTIGNRGDQEQ